MSRVITVLILIAGPLAGPGCIIGTWPTPESEKTPQNNGTDAVGEEACDDLDDDADGSVDEGCDCSGDVPRGCVASIGGQCGFGLQRCADGVWQACGDLGPPYSAPREVGVEITSLDQPRMTRGGSEVLTVEVAATAACSGIQVPAVPATLQSELPAMRLFATLLDDGQTPDRVADDGIFTASLANPFGPGVPAQTLYLRVEAILSGEQVSDSATLPLEEP
jgi:hypothetical protein